MMKFKLSCADFTFPLLPHEDALSLIAMLHVDAVDIGLFSGASHVQPKEVTKNIASAARELSTRVYDKGLVISDIYLIPGPDFNTLTVNHPQAKVRHQSRDLFQRILEFTVRCNATHMSTLPGMPWDDEIHDTSIARSSEELAWRCEQAAKMGIIISVEPHIGSVIQTPQLATQLIEMTPGLTLTLDYGHFVYQGFTVRQIEPLIKHASHFHARGAAHDRLQTTMKDNTIDFLRILRAMKRTNYKGYVALEYCWDEWLRCNEADTLAETILLRDVIRKAKI